MRAGWLVIRGATFLGVIVFAFLGGLSWIALPGRFLLGLLGAAGPEAGRYAVLLSGAFYASAALLATVLRRDAEEPSVSLELLA
jgi:hypothetical protein